MYPRLFVMEIILYKTISSPETVSKTLTDGLTVNGALRNSNNVIQPYVEMTTDVTNYNYAYIPQYKRYYFVTGYRVVRTGLFSVSLSVDVLMTYKDAILELHGNRTKGDDSNPYSSDANYNYEVRKQVKQLKFAYTFERQTEMVLVGLVGAE